MITYLKNVIYAFSPNKRLIEIVCLSSDTKPTQDVKNGSVCLEMDTKDVYFFDGSSESWIKFGVKAK